MGDSGVCIYYPLSDRTASARDVPQATLCRPTERGRWRPMPKRITLRNKTAKAGTVTAINAGNANLNELAYRTIKEDIISCALQPGEAISEAVLVARYELSKAPIRSALVRLRQEGLVISRGRMGNIVSPVTLRDVQEIFQLRLVLEVATIKLAAGNVDPARIRELNNAVLAGYAPRRRSKRGRLSAGQPGVSSLCRRGIGKPAPCSSGHRSDGATRAHRSSRAFPAEARARVFCTSTTSWSTP